MKISIIIPTRERLQYLRHSLATVLTLDDQDVEIIVSDNDSHDGTSVFLTGLADTRLKVVGPGHRVSMRQNWECALSHATGDYVIFFGDDDALLPGQFAALRAILDRYQPDCLTWPALRYRWPQAKGGRRYGTLRFERSKLFGSAQSVENDSMRTGMLSRSENWHLLCPVIYHGAVSRRYLDRMRLSDHDFFADKMPDVYFTMLAILCGNTQVHCDHPFTVSGESAASSGASYGRKRSKTATDPSQTVDPGQRFLIEVATDPIQDRHPIGFGVPAAIFETLEAALPVARVLAPENTFQPDYAAWYRYVLTHSTHLPTKEVTRIRANLLAHAKATDNLPALQQALAAADRALPLHKLAPARFRARWKKLRGKVRSFRVTAQRGDQNTVQTAAALVDSLLGEDFAAVLSGEMEPRKAWKQAKRRSKGFKRRL